MQKTNDIKGRTVQRKNIQENKEATRTEQKRHNKEKGLQENKKRRQHNQPFKFACQKICNLKTCRTCDSCERVSETWTNQIPPREVPLADFPASESIKFKRATLPQMRSQRFRYIRS